MFGPLTQRLSTRHYLISEPCHPRAALSRDGWPKHPTPPCKKPRGRCRAPSSAIDAVTYIRGRH